MIHRRWRKNFGVFQAVVQTLEQKQFFERVVAECNNFLHCFLEHSGTFPINNVNLQIFAYIAAVVVVDVVFPHHFEQIHIGWIVVVEFLVEVMLACHAHIVTLVHHIAQRIQTIVFVHVEKFIVVFCKHSIYLVFKFFHTGFVVGEEYIVAFFT